MLDMNKTWQLKGYVLFFFFFLSNQVFSKIVHKGIRYSCLYQVRIIGGAMHLPKDEQSGSDSPRTSIVSSPQMMFQLPANQTPT